MKIAIGTVNWNRKQDTSEFLQSLSKLDVRGLQTKTFIVSNQQIPRHKVILKRKNRGSAGGYNDAARKALKWGADYILLCNNDVLFKSRQLLKSLVETANLQPEIGVVAPKMLFASGFEFHKERYKKTDLGKVIWYAGGHFDWNSVFSVHHGIDEVDTGRYDLVEETEFVNITCILVKSAVFKKELFFDEKIFAYFDDNDWSQRLTQAGFKKYYDGRVAVFHKVNQTSGTGSPLSDYYLTRNRLIFGVRYAPLRTALALLREALRILFSGRPAQRRGVIDFFLGKRGALGRQIT